ncbi:hypothetical protein OAN70_02040 [Candidatus Pelagibacter sp.]|nr:hypothetical protein [Candidatus Pelagibacter sp.]
MTSVSSSLVAFFSYLEPNIICPSLSFNELHIPEISIGLKDPSALKIQKYSVLTLLIPKINASP